MKRITVTAPKGGVGKTFVAAHLCRVLGTYEGVRPGIIDFGASQNACQWLDRRGFVKSRRQHEHNFVFRASRGEVIASCCDWDKDQTRRNDYNDLIHNPNSPPGSLTDGKLLKNLNVFVYDTDHWIRSFANFMQYFDVVLILIDPDDIDSMRNVADHWSILSNGKKIGKIKTEIVILANRCRKPGAAWASMSRFATLVFEDQMLSNKQIREYLAELKVCFVHDFSIPRFNSAAKAAQASSAVWEFEKSAEDVFDNLAEMVGVGDLV
jgi:hypothetical protein